MFLEVTEVIIFVVSLWTTSVMGGTFFNLTQQVSQYSSFLTCVDGFCRSRVHAGAQCITAIPGCRGIWFIDDGSTALKCGLCSCLTNFTHTTPSLGNIIPALHSPTYSTASKNHQAHSYFRPNCQHFTSRIYMSANTLRPRQNG